MNPLSNNRSSAAVLRGMGSLLDIGPASLPPRQGTPATERAWSRVMGSVQMSERSLKEAIYKFDAADESVIARREFDDLLNQLYRFHVSVLNERWKTFTTTDQDILYQLPLTGRGAHPLLYLPWYRVSSESILTLFAFTDTPESAIDSLLASTRYELQLAFRRDDPKFDNYIPYLLEVYRITRMQLAIKYRR